ncbi:hypothetical protein BGX26_008117, partial [Mortierella sp. AD094]
MSHGPGLTSSDSGGVWLKQDLINSILFDDFRIYEQTFCTSPDDIEFVYNDYLAWDGGNTGYYNYVYSTGSLQWMFGKDPKLCTGSYSSTYDPHCNKCTSTEYSVSPMHKRVGGGSLGVGGGFYHFYEISNGDDKGSQKYTLPVMYGLDCQNPSTCNNWLIDPSHFWNDDFEWGLTPDIYIIPDNYQIYNIHFTAPSGLDIGVLMTWGSEVVLEYAPVQKSFDSLVVNGTTHIIPGASSNMEWTPYAASSPGPLGRSEYLFGGHTAYTIGSGGSDITYYNINTPPGMP